MEELDLRRNQLTGTIPPRLSDLDRLETLYLSQNQLAGCIPAGLRDVAENDLDELGLPFCEVPTSVCVDGGAVADAANNEGLVSDCEALLAARDTLAGSARLNWSVDTPITGWDGVTVGGEPQRVTELRLYDRQLTGKLTAELGNLSSLRHFGLSQNQLTGEIPSALGSLSNLRYLNLSQNQLTGEMPTKLGNLSNLAELYLLNNTLTGGYRPRWAGSPTCNT